MILAHDLASLRHHIRSNPKTQKELRRKAAQLFLRLCPNITTKNDSAISSFGTKHFPFCG